MVSQQVAAGQNSSPPPHKVDPAQIKTYPALLGGQNDIPEVIVVSSVDNNDESELGVRYSDYTIAAMVDEAHCANSQGGGPNDYRDEPGTLSGKSTTSNYRSAKDTANTKCISNCSHRRPYSLLHGPWQIGCRCSNAALEQRLRTRQPRAQQTQGDLEWH